MEKPAAVNGGAEMGVPEKRDSTGGGEVVVVVQNGKDPPAKQLAESSHRPAPAGIASPEIGMPEKRNSAGGGEAVVVVVQDGKDPPPKQPAESSHRPNPAVPAGIVSPEIGISCRSPNKPPKVPTAGNDTLLRRKSLPRSVFSKPKSRFGEQPVSIDSNVLEEHKTLQDQFGVNSPFRASLRRGSPDNQSASIRTLSIQTASPGTAGLDEAEEIYRKVSEDRDKRNGVKTTVVIECIALLGLVGLLAASLTVPTLEDYVIWGLEVWKWCVLVLVTVCGLLVTNWFMNVVVFLIEKNYLLKNKVLYFVYGLKKSVQVFIWLCVVLFTWVLLFNRGVKRSKHATKILNYVTWTLVSLVLGSCLWLVKTLLMKILASNFHLNRFFERTQESIFHHYVLQTLSGPPLIEEAERVGRSPSIGQLSLTSNKKKSKGGKEKKQVIDMYTLHKMKQGKVSSWYMKTLVDAVTSSGLTMSNTLQNFDDGEGHHEITSEMEATAAAYQIFKNVAQPGCKYIEEEDLLRFMIKEEVDIVFPLFEGVENGRINLKSLTIWVVKVYQGRKTLAHALSDTKTAVKQLNKLITGILIVLGVIMWLLLTEIATTKLLVVFSSQLVVAAFIFGNTCKTIFEAIIFVFVMHPYDVGDRCVVDGVPLLVEEMNILNTVFLKLDKEKVYYPNSVLSTKPISNYYRSPDMGDTLEFSIAFTTPVEKIGLLKERIKKYLIENSQHWHPNHNVLVKEIENVNKIKMALICNHTMNFQDYPEKNRRRTELVIELKRMFEELGVKYDLPNQEVQVTQFRSET